MKKAWIDQLEAQGCWSDDWNRVSLAESADLRKIRNVFFRGEVSIGRNPEIINVPGGLANVRIGDNVRIVNVARIETNPDANFGVGTDVAVLDETGHRIVRIYPGISAQIATLSTRMPDFAVEKLMPLIDRHIKSLPDIPEIGDNVEIIDCGSISGVRIWPNVKVEGAMNLKNGSIVNNSANGIPLAYVGHGVDMENFIVEDAEVKGGCFLRNVYVGQGSLIDKRFTAHDSLFFANCTMECGEACAVLAGPYSVSMHKSTLLIGCQTCFFNAGSGTNMSNHKYKIGPVHWGVLERGAKTASNAYIMHGAHIGAYSLVMGDHKSHPDTTVFPFSYLFGNEKGETIVLPGAMLKSYGLKRDEEKWPERDRRLNRGIPLHDRITFPVFNPYTVGGILRALDLSDKLVALVPGEEIDYNGIKLRKKHILDGTKYYEFALSLYVSRYLSKLKGEIPLLKEYPEAKLWKEAKLDWIDLGGQLIPAAVLDSIRQASSIVEIEKILDKIAGDYDFLEKEWIEQHLQLWLHNADIDDFGTAGYYDLLEKDRLSAIDSLNSEQSHMDLII